MTFSRPAIERLIATVESGLKYGELGPYAEGLKALIQRVTNQDEELQANAERAQRELMSPTTECVRLRAAIAVLQGVIDSGNEAFRVAREQWRADVARLTKELDGMLPVVEAAEEWRDVDVDDTSESDRLMLAVDAWRARKAGGE
jgi:hypothetical protein